MRGLADLSIHVTSDNDKNDISRNTTYCDTVVADNLPHMQHNMVRRSVNGFKAQG